MRLPRLRHDGPQGGVARERGQDGVLEEVVVPQEALRPHARQTHVDLLRGRCARVTAAAAAAAGAAAAGGQLVAHPPAPAATVPALSPNWYLGSDDEDDEDDEDDDDEEGE